MTVVVPPLVSDQLIVEALAELRSARADQAHSPNAEREQAVTCAEKRLNRLLEQRRPIPA